MVRLEFIKGQGGVVNIINGNLRDTDRSALTNIEDIDKVIVNSTDAIAINNELNACEMGGYIIVFASIVKMQPYLDQIDLVDGELFNPGVNGVQKPDWDVASRNKTVGIQAHSYIDTNIEKELIEGK
jgi:hypothetical protein